VLWLSSVVVAGKEGGEERRGDKFGSVGGRTVKFHDTLPFADSKNQQLLVSQVLLRTRANFKHVQINGLAVRRYISLQNE